MSQSKQINSQFQTLLTESLNSPESLSWTTGDSDICSVDSFNQFLFRLSNQKQSENYRSSKANDPTERTSNYQSSQLFEQPTEIRHTDRNRPFLDIGQNNLLMQQNSLLAEQNKVLSQQVDSLKTILTGYSEVEQELQDKISIFQAEKQAQQALISALKDRYPKSNRAVFRRIYSRTFNAT